MERRDFFRKLGIGVASVIVAPKILAEMPAKGEIKKFNSIKAPYLTPKEVLKTWRQTGQLVYPSKSRYVQGDLFVVNGKKYLLVNIFAYTNWVWHYTLRPLEAGDDIEITEYDLNHCGVYNGCVYLDKKI